MRSVFIACLLLAASGAQATTVTIDFEEYAGSNPPFALIEEPLNLDNGFTLNFSHPGVWLSNTFGPSPTSQAIGVTDQSWLQLSYSGGVFSLDSFDWDFQNIGDNSLRFSARRLDGTTVTESVPVTDPDSLWKLHTVGSPFENLVSLSIYNDTNTLLALDNITATVSTVPVPAAFWLFGSALAAVAARRRA